VRAIVVSLVVAGLFALGAAQAARKDEGCPVTFTDVAASAGLKFTHERGATPEHHLPETMGSGLAWLDYDNDGWMDLYVVQSGPFPPNGSPKGQDRLYHNNRDGTFTDVTEKAGLHDTAYGMGVVAGDYDNDGWTDLYVTNFGRNILYHNNRDGTFTDVTEKAGVGGSGWSTSAAFADFDGDGFLDLFVVRYLEIDVATEPACVNPETERRIYCYPMFFPSVSNLLFHNNGNGTFTDITTSSGVGKALGKGLGVVVVDFDDDGKPDIYVANDTTMNFLFRNLGGDKFQDVSLSSGAGLSASGRYFGGMGANAGDLHGSGRLDLVVANYEGEPNSLFRNLGDGVFEDVSVKSGFGTAGLGFVAFGLNLLDASNSGRLDAFVTNGHVQEVPRSPNVTYSQRPRLLWNDGKGHFTERACGEPFERALVGRGSAIADFDNDGGMDIAVSNSGGPLELLHNEGKRGGWVGFLLRGTKSNRQGIGARVILETSAGKQIREIRAGDSYLSSSDPRVHFGLGDATIKKVEIRWPSGIVQQVENVRPGRYQVVEERGPVIPAAKK
jgi:hypothetical protein